MKPLSDTPQTDAAHDATLSPDYEYVGAETEAWAFARELEIDRDYYKKALRSAENIVLNYLRDKERLERELNALKAEPASIVHQCRIDGTPTVNNQSHITATIYSS